MQITATGFLLLSISIFLFVLPIKYSIYIVLITYVMQSSSFCLIGKGQIPLYIVSELFFIFHVLFNIFLKKERIKVSKKFIPLILMWFYLLILTLVSPILFEDVQIFNISTNTFSSPVLSAGRLGVVLFILCDIITVICLSNQPDEITPHEIVCLLKILILIVFIIGLWHYFSINGLLESRSIEIFKKWIYSDSIATPHWKQKRFLSTFYEPSYCGVFLSSIFWGLYFLYKKIDRSNFVWFSLILIMLVLNVSTTGIVTFLAGGCIYILFFWKHIKITKRGMYTFMLILVCFICIGVVLMRNEKFMNLLIFHTVNKTTSSSFLQRYTWEKNAWKVGIKGVYGIGTGMNYGRSNSLFSNLVLQSGIIGTILYGVFCTKMLVELKTRFDNRIASFSFIYIICTLIAQLFSCPDIYFTVTWFGFALASIKTNEKATNSKAMTIKKN